MVILLWQKNNMQIKYLNYNIIIILIITLLLTYFLLSQIDFSDIFGLFGEINYSYIVISFIFYLGLAFLRALRIQLIIKHKIDYKILFATILTNNFLAILLPFKIGELSLPILLNKYSGIEKKEGMLMLFYLRTIDIFIILLSLLVVVTLFADKIFQLRDISLLLILTLLSLTAILLLKSDKIILFIGRLFKTNDLLNLTKKLASTYEFYKSKMATAIILSCLIFATLTFVLGFMINAYPISLSYLDIILISLIIIITTSLPINGIAGMGGLDLSISVFLMSTGISKDLSISIAFNYHFIYFMFIMFFGCMGYLFLNYRKYFLHQRS